MRSEGSPSDSSSPKTPQSSTPSSDPSLNAITTEDEEFKNVHYAQGVLKRLESSFEQGQLCDVTLIVGSKRIPAHRIVLSSASDYFSGMFNSPVIEARQQEIELKDIDPQAMEAVIKYCYTGKIELREETVEAILATAHQLLLDEVTDACCQFLTKLLHPTNTLGIQLFAESLGCAQLNRIATSYTEEHFLDVIKQQEFLQLPKSEIRNLLKSDSINVPKEESVYKALLLWLNHDLELRKEYLGDLLSHVKLPLLSASFLVDHVEPNRLITENAECRVLLMEAMKFHLLPERQMEMCIPRTSPRNSTVGYFYIVGGMHANKVGPYTIERFNLLSNTWSPTTTMNGRRLQIGVAVKDEKIYIAGGRDGLKTLNTFDCYDPKADMWTPLTPMSTHRHGLGVGVLEGPLYAVGGHDGWSYLNNVERWDPQLKQWNFVASMSSARSTVGVAVLNGRLYAVGGRDGSSCLRTVECFDPHTNRWSLCAPMNQRRGAVAVVVVNGLMYAIGGHDAPASNPTASRFDSAERYDPATDTWTEIASMQYGCDSAAVGVLGGKIFCVGGFDGQTYLTETQCYDPQNNEWSTLASLSIGRAGACGAVVIGVQ